jgi:hypothetical protein
MDAERFWELIALSRANSNGSMDSQVEALKNELIKLSPEEIVEFNNRFTDAMEQAFRWELCDAAFLIAGDDDFLEEDFMDFRSWLISMGKETFDAALEDPDSLVDKVNFSEIEDCFFEDLMYVPFDAYQKKTGKELLVTEREVSSEPGGNPCENEKRLKKRFPKLWKEFRE